MVKNSKESNFKNCQHKKYLLENSENVKKSSSIIILPSAFLDCKRLFAKVDLSDTVNDLKEIHKLAGFF